MDTTAIRNLYRISKRTVYRWSEKGLLTYTSPPTGRRIYAEKKTESDKASEKESVCYCRVSSTKQTDDLERQMEFCRARYPRHRIISDVGSGLNYRRKGLKRLVELAEAGTLEEVVVTHRDRLSRFSFEFFSWFFAKHGVRLVVLYLKMGTNESELAKDILSVL